VTLVTIAGWQVTYSSGTIRGVWIPSDVIGDVFFPPNQEEMPRRLKPLLSLGSL
jgi:hypothetical protein